MLEAAKSDINLNSYAERAARQLIQPDRPQLGFHDACVLRLRLYGIVGRRVNSGVSHMLDK